MAAAVQERAARVKPDDELIAIRAAAVANRRACRAARQVSEHERRLRRDERDRDVADRMTRRFYRGQMPALICFDYRYWQARRCGWDALSEDFARDPIGRPCDPHNSVMWHFWTSLHYKTRSHLVTLSTFRLSRR